MLVVVPVRENLILHLSLEFKAIYAYIHLFSMVVIHKARGWYRGYIE